MENFLNNRRHLTLIFGKNFLKRALTISFFFKTFIIVFDTVLPKVLKRVRDERC